MRNNKSRSLFTVHCSLFYISLATCYLLLATFLTACGRRGDPVAIIPHEVRIDSYREGDVIKDSEASTGERVKPEPKEVEIISPEAPKGLIAVYTQKSIVLTWNEVQMQEIKFYRIYRSEGKDFIVVGESVTPAFTDKNIEASKKYYYRVTAVGETEGYPSKEIEVVTEAR